MTLQRFINILRLYYIYAVSKENKSNEYFRRPFFIRSIWLVSLLIVVRIVMDTDLSS